MSDKTFTAGSEEDFIRMLQEQMANGGISDDIDLSSLTLPDDAQDGSAEDSEKEKKEKNKFQRPVTLSDRIIKITKWNRAVVENGVKVVMYFVIPLILNVLLLFVFSGFDAFTKIILLLAITGGFSFYLTRLMAKSQRRQSSSSIFRRSNDSFSATARGEERISSIGVSKRLPSESTPSASRQHGITVPSTCTAT